MPVPSDSGRRLGAAVLAYLVVVTLLITWAPFDFFSTPQHGLTTRWTWSDLLLNVVMFLPLGFLWQGTCTAAHAAPVERRRGAERTAVHQAALVGLLLSAAIEGGQLFLPGRFTSLLDLATNTLGAALGALAFVAVRPRLTVDSGTMRSLALDLPLAGVVVLLVPLLWTSAFGDGDPARLRLLWPVAVSGGVLIGSIHGSYLAVATRGSARLAAVAAVAWLLVGALPALLRVTTFDAMRDLLGACVVAGAVAALRSRVAARARERDGAQRVEHAALRLAMPPFAAYVTVAALWPVDALDGRWRAAWTLAPAADGLSRGLLLASLAHLATFTLVGYVTAEFHGRDNARFAEGWPRVARRVAPLALLLEWARGWNASVGASAVVLVLAVLSGLFGGWLYHLQRDHVRALRARDRAVRTAATRTAATRTAQGALDPLPVASPSRAT